jgi:probable HAF family extracellular repeat protein
MPKLGAMMDWGRRHVTLLGVVVVASAVAGSGAHATPYDFTTINLPGSYYTTAYGINNAGTVVGSYSDASNAPDHGFLYSGGNFATIDVPGAYATQVLGINNASQIVGSYEDTTPIPEWAS